MQPAIFENARILDGSSDEGEHDRFVRVADGLIKEISDKPIKDSSAHRIDLRGKTLMPGLIDCHVHIVSPLPDPADFARLPEFVCRAAGRPHHEADAFARVHQRT